MTTYLFEVSFMKRGKIIHKNLTVKAKDFSVALNKVKQKYGNNYGFQVNSFGTLGPRIQGDD